LCGWKITERYASDIAVVQKAVDNSSIIWITYTGGSKPNTSRPVVPIKWIKKFQLPGEVSE